MGLKDILDNVKNVGDSISNFSGDGAEIEKPESTKKVETDNYMKNKRIAVITISVTGYCGKELTKLEDRFNLLVEYDEKHDNTKVLVLKLQNIEKQIQRLIDIWTKEVE